ncbi:MAG: NUDIX hydrolase [Promethearchaeota archaeon]|nr:MAG: NUDIX hydrolase [Candidatus Lokiarchaeota archaeon]
MPKQIKFIYKEEYWFISAFINTNKKIKIAKIVEKLNDLVKKRIINITAKDAYRKEYAKDLVKMAKNISLKCRWVQYIPNFPYYNENMDKFFDMLGYFYFEVEYFKDTPQKKTEIEPHLLQQIPYLILAELKKNRNDFLDNGVYFDLESPIYIFAISDKTDPSDIEWYEETVKDYKNNLSAWTVLYSGQWEDYSPRLFEERVKNNLSNRLSELHYINRNSGFVYMQEQNYKKHFEEYMIDNVLKPSAEIRAIMFSLREINNSLDIVFLNTHSEGIINIEKLEDKIKNLRFLRGILQNTLSRIYNELDYNRRQHYTSVLKHLVEKFDLKGVKERLNNKFDLLYDTIQEIYQKQVQADQEETEKALNILNFLLGAGILADLVELIMVALSLNSGDFPAIFLNSIFAIIISGVLAFAIIYYVFVRIKIKRERAKKTVDGIILNNDKTKIILIKRKYPPFQGHYALPGGFINRGETPEDALEREMSEETNLDVSIIEKVGYYDESGRDPRGEVHSTAFLCKVKGNENALGGSDALSAEFIPINKLKEIKLAFDHREMLEDAGIIKKDSIFD